VVEDTTVVSALTGSYSFGVSTDTLTMRRVVFRDTEQLAVGVTDGTTRVENSTIEIATGSAFSVIANSADDANLSADHVTIVNTGSSNQSPLAVTAESGSGDAAGELTNSIARGFDYGCQRATLGGSTGASYATVRYSNVDPDCVSTGAGTTDIATGNINVDPLFASATDLHLQPSSPSVDAGDPADALVTDFDNLPRPTDGNGDGTARSDQGAYEYQPAPSPTSDTTPPETTIDKGPGKKLRRKGKATFRFSASEAGATFECRLDRKQFRPCNSPRKVKRVKFGRHAFSVRAIDAVGNVDQTPAKRRFRRKR